MATVAKNYRTSETTVAVSSVGPFSLGFRLFDDDGIKVYVNGEVRTDFTLASSYSDGYDAAASITFDAALSVSDVLRIDSALKPWREEDLVNGDQNLVQKMNVEFARLWSAIADVNRNALRAVRGFDIIEPADGIDFASIADAEANAVAAADSAAAAAASAAAALAAENSLIEWKGAWVTATAYAPSDIVSNGGNTYICLIAHTSTVFQTDQLASRWELFVTKGASGSGSGDVLAANNGSEYTASAATFRSNIGLGSVATTTTAVTDWNDATSNGFYHGDGSALNSPTATDYRGFVSAVSSAEVAQILVERATNRAYFRRKAAGSWGSWAQFIHTGNVANYLPATVPGWQPYDDATGVIYDFAEDGAVATIETPDFEDGYEYMLVIDMLEAASGTPHMEVEFYREQASAYSSKALLSTVNQKYHVGEAVFQLPRVSKRSHHVTKTLFAAGSIVNASRSNDTTYMTSVIHTTATAILKARLSFNNAANFAGGTVTMLRRPEGLS